MSLLIYYVFIGKEFGINTYLIEEWARSTSAPTARRTYDGSSDADVQAEPDDSATPGTLMRSDSPSTAANDMFKIPG